MLCEEVLYAYPPRSVRNCGRVQVILETLENSNVTKAVGSIAADLRLRDRRMKCCSQACFSLQTLGQQNGHTLTTSEDEESGCRQKLFSRFPSCKEEVRIEIASDETFSYLSSPRSALVPHLFPGRDYCTVDHILLCETGPSQVEARKWVSC